MMKLGTIAGAVLLLALNAGAPGAARATDDGPTCSDIEFLDIVVHGQHVVRDYVMGLDHDALQWSPRGGLVGQKVAENGGAAIPGGPGPGFHFEANVAPGASFCTDSNSPGSHF